MFLRVLLVFILLAINVYGKVIKEKTVRDGRLVYTVRLHTAPVIKAFWVKLEKGGYMFSGKIEDYRCETLTDFSFDEIVETIKKEYGYIRYRLYVKSINAVVLPNKEPFMAKPFRMNINPTVTDDIYLINRYLKNKLKELIDKDENYRKKFEEYKKYYTDAGFSTEEAERKAFIKLSKIVDVDIKSWIPEEKLPKKLFMVCSTDLEEKGLTIRHIYDVYPVEISVKKDKHIEILKIKKEDTFISVEAYIYPHITKETKYLMFDLITLNPIPVKAKNCKHGYIGIYPHPSEYEKEYSDSLQSMDNGFFLVLMPYETVKEIRFKLKIDLYCSTEERKEISLLNPVDKDVSKLSSYYQMNYSIKGFLKRYGLKNIKLKFRIVSPQGYSSDLLELSIP
ncbi:hypothetical protein [Persephonella sp.]